MYTFYSTAMQVVAQTSYEKIGCFFLGFVIKQKVEVVYRCNSCIKCVPHSSLYKASTENSHVVLSDSSDSEVISFLDWG